MADKPIALPGEKQLSVAEEIALGKKAAKTRLAQAPASVGDGLVVARKALIQKYSPRSKGEQDRRTGEWVKKPSTHACFVGLDQYKKWIHRGYWPAVDESKERVIDGDDVLLECPFEMFERKLAAAKAVSDFQTAEPPKDEVGGAVSESMEQIAPDDPRYEQVINQASAGIHPNDEKDTEKEE